MSLFNSPFALRLGLALTTFTTVCLLFSTFHTPSPPSLPKCVLILLYHPAMLTLPCLVKGRSGAHRDVRVRARRHSVDEGECVRRVRRAARDVPAAVRRAVHPLCRRRAEQLARGQDTRDGGAFSPAAPRTLALTRPRSTRTSSRSAARPSATTTSTSTPRTRRSRQA